MDNVSASPLSWPTWKERTPSNQRKSSQFGRRSATGYGKEQLSISQAVGRVMEQIDGFTKPGRKWRTTDVVISTNLELRKDNLPRSGQRMPDDPGASVWFQLDGEPKVIPCDVYDRVADNLAAIAATLEALRTIERHDSGMFRSAFTGFAALENNPTTNDWMSVLGVDYGDSLETVKNAYRRLASENHPDKGGDRDKFDAINAAWKQAQQALK